MPTFSKRILSSFLSLLLPLSSPVWAESESIFQFYEEEAKVVSASRQAIPRELAPATVYVVTQEDLRASGVQNIWDALRGVPGVDVIQTRTNQAEVSIRGLDRPINNRTLVLLDGKTVLNAFFDFVLWEAIPVSLEDIDRIEIVEGPASAVYGANAINGVINIITKKPTQWQGGQLSYSGGEQNTHFGSYRYGRQNKIWGYKFGAGWRSMNRFENSDQFASQAGKFDALVSYTPTEDTEWSASGGYVDYNTQTTAGGAGSLFNKGSSSFMRTDFRRHNTRARAFWNHDETLLDQFVALGNGHLHSDTYDVELDHSLELPGRHAVVVGSHFRSNTARSSVLPPGPYTQNLWALYAEDRWEFSRRWLLMASGRLDSHPFIPVTFSPRASLLFLPVKDQVFRASAGSAFRNPTLLENAIQSTLVVPNSSSVTNPPFTTIQSTTLGNPDLAPERIDTVEIGHQGRFGFLETNITGFHYILKQIIRGSDPQITGMTPPTLALNSTFINSGEIRAWGGETGIKVHWTSGLSLYANYSYQDLKDSGNEQTISPQSPRHKANFGIRAKRKGWTGDLQTHWVDMTRWMSVIGQGTEADMRPVSAYFLVNASLRYAFSNGLQGLETGVSVFNLLNHAHYEILPATSASRPGQFGEIIRSRWMGTISYRF
jgi:iron complex outermembrane recepter protein